MRIVRRGEHVNDENGGVGMGAEAEAEDDDCVRARGRGHTRGWGGGPVTSQRQNRIRQTDLGTGGGHVEELKLQGRGGQHGGSGGDRDGDMPVIPQHRQMPRVRQVPGQGCKVGARGAQLKAPVG